MRICFFGNQDNAGYRLCKWFRESGHDAHLYMMSKGESARSKPEAIDRELDDVDYPHWIRFYENTVWKTLTGDRKTVLEIEQEFDIVVVMGGLGMMNAFRINKLPIINISTGPSNQGVIKMWDHLSIKHAVYYRIVRYFVRKSVQKCQKILVHYDPEIYSLAKLNHLGKILFYGMPEDVEGNKKRIDHVRLDELNKSYSQYDKVFLWLGRIDFSHPDSPMYKGTDKFLDAAARIVDEGCNVKVIMSTHGEDYELLKQKVEEKGLGNAIDWVQHMPYWELLTHMSMKNAIVFDELTDMHCVSSGMFRECLSVGAVLVRSYSPILTAAGHGPNCPVLHAEACDEVYGRMQEVLGWSLEEFSEKQGEVAVWADEYLDWRVQINRLTQIFEEASYAYRTAEHMKSRYE